MAVDLWLGLFFIFTGKISQDHYKETKFHYHLPVCKIQEEEFSRRCSTLLWTSTTNIIFCFLLLNGHLHPPF